MWMAHEQGPGMSLCYTLLVLWGWCGIQLLCRMVSLRCAGILSELLHEPRVGLSHRTRPSHCCESIWQLHLVAWSENGDRSIMLWRSIGQQSTNHQ